MHRFLSALAFTALLAPPVALRAQQPTPAVLGPGDRLLVKLWVDSAFADTVRLSPAGRAILPRLGSVALAGVPLTAVGDSVRRAYTGVLANPVVEVTPLIRVTAVGELRSPNVYFVEPGTSIRDVIARAGGVAPEGRRDGVMLVRGGTERRLPDWATDDGSRTPLVSGDVVYVVRESWVRRNTLSLLSTATVVASLIISATR
jgi:protein involved in polysaccharide export with SLBB domain